jgi:hypothetical protein
MFLRRTNTGRVVYERDRHDFRISDASRIVSKLELSEPGTSRWAKDALALLDLKDSVDTLFENLDFVGLSFDLESVVQEIVDWLIKDQEHQRRRIEEYVRLIENRLGPQSRSFGKSLARATIAQIVTRSALGSPELGGRAANQARANLTAEWSLIGNLLSLGGSRGQSD